MQDVLVRDRNGERGPLVLGRDAELGQEGRGSPTSGRGAERDMEARRVSTPGWGAEQVPNPSAGSRLLSGVVSKLVMGGNAKPGLTGRNVTGWMLSRVYGKHVRSRLKKHRRAEEN